MQDKPVIDGIECRYWFRVNPRDYRKCSLRGGNDNCVEIKDCFIKELLGKLAQKEQECERLKKDIKDITNLLDLDTGEEYNFGNIEMEIKELKTENEKNKQILVEIEEIAKSEIDSKEFMVVQCMLNGSVDNKNKILGQILQKIKECEVENAKN